MPEVYICPVCGILVADMAFHKRSDEFIYQIADQGDEHHLHADVAQQGKRRHHPIRQVEYQFIHRIGEGLYKPVQKGRDDLQEVESHEEIDNYRIDQQPKPFQRTDLQQVGAFPFRYFPHLFPHIAE